SSSRRCSISCRSCISDFKAADAGSRADDVRQVRSPPRLFIASQYVSRTKFLPLSADWSSYLLLPDRFGSLTFVCAIFLYGIDLRMCAMQLSRARRLSSDRTMYHGACLLSVAFSIMSRARE